MSLSNNIPKKEDPQVLEVYITDDNSFRLDVLDCTEPHVVMLGIGDFTDTQLKSSVMHGIISSIPAIKWVILPKQIPTSATLLLSPLFGQDPGFHIHWLKDGKNGLDLKLYHMKPGYMVSELNRYHPQKGDDPVNVQHPSDQHPHRGVPDLAKPVSAMGYKPPESVLDDANHTDGFTHIDTSDAPTLPTVQDGFHEIKDGVIPPDTSDGLIDLDAIQATVEKRKMWEEDPKRMERLSFTTVAAIRGDTTYPAQLGGGPIKGRN